MSKIKPLARKNDIVIQEFGNEILIYDLKSNKAYNLNETSALIWQLSNGDNTICEIAGNITKRLNSSINEEFVWLALEQLRKENLIENKTEISSLYQGISRREIIRRVGLASMVALPLVSSLVAPTAVSAASTCAIGTCRCPNITDNCAGNATSPPIAGGPYVNCNTVGGTPTCDCLGPYGGNDSAGAGFRLGTGCGPNP